MSIQQESSPRTLHDRIFKEFLRHFLPQFLRLFFPAEAARLNFATLHFLDKELVINLPNQELRITDVIAEVETWQGEPEAIIVHVEVEASNRQTLPRRMSEYYALLRILRERRVLPIALVLLPNAGGLIWQTYSEELFGHELLRFTYGQVGIRDLSSAEYLAEQDPIAAALAALMKPVDESQAAIKLSALRTVVDSELSDGDKLFLVELVNIYLPTTGLADAREEIMQELTNIELTWGEKLRAEGREEGREEGEREGKRTLLLRILTLLFGELPGDRVAYLSAMTDDADFDELTQRMLTAKRLEDIFPPDTSPLRPA